MALVQVRGTQLEVEESGSGPPALVLHGGLGIDHRPYRSLDPLGDWLHLVYYDHRGNGRSGGPLEGTNMRQWAGDGVALAQLAAPGHPVVVIGHSYGGFVAQEMAIAHPEAVRALILLCTTPGQLGHDEAPAPAGPPIPPEFQSMLATPPATNAELAAGMARLAPAYLHRAPPERLTSLLANVDFRVDAMRRGFEVLAHWSSVDRLHAVHAPTLVIAGRHDPFTAWPQAERITSRLPDAELVVFEQSSHFPWLDEPEEFFACVHGWLDRRGLLSP